MIFIDSSVDNLLLRHVVVLGRSFFFRLKRVIGRNKRRINVSFRIEVEFINFLDIQLTIINEGLCKNNCSLKFNNFNIQNENQKNPKINFFQSLINS